jgi:hypothetical protein
VLRRGSAKRSSAATKIWFSTVRPPPRKIADFEGGNLKRAVAPGVKLGRTDSATERGVVKVAKSLGIGTGTVQRTRRSEQ